MTIAAHIFSSKAGGAATTERKVGRAPQPCQMRGRHRGRAKRERGGSRQTPASLITRQLAKKGRCDHLLWRALRLLMSAIFGANRILSLISGRRQPVSAPRRGRCCRRRSLLSRGADRDFFDFAADEGLELGE